MKHPKIKIEMENGGIMVAELYPEFAPITVENFLKLVDVHFYDNLSFHRCIPGFVIQGGCPDGTGCGGPGYSIKGEFSKNGVNNPLIHEKGVLSMARSSHPDSAGSQFFIMVDKTPHLDGSYAAFGKLIEGIDVAESIVAQPTDYQDKPRTPQIMKSVSIVDEA